MTTERASIARFNAIVLRLSQGKTQQHEREGLRLRVTTLEASLVDCLALMELSEEVRGRRGRTDPRGMIKHALHFKRPPSTHVWASFSCAPAST